MAETKEVLDELEQKLKDALDVIRVLKATSFGPLQKKRNERIRHCGQWNNNEMKCLEEEKKDMCKWEIFGEGTPHQFRACTIPESLRREYDETVQAYFAAENEFYKKYQKQYGRKNLELLLKKIYDQK